jgi:hypothetical protein
MNLKWISFDTFQSADSIQLLRQKGFTTGTYSMDTTSIPYDFTKSAFYDGRIKAPVHDKALSEMIWEARVHLPAWRSPFPRSTWQAPCLATGQPE